MDLENLKQLMFGTRIQPSASQATLFELIFWPDAFLLGSLLFSTLLLVAIRLFFRKMTLLKIRAGVISVSVIFLFRFVCFLMLVASVSATARMLFFVFGESGGARWESGGRQYFFGDLVDSDLLVRVAGRRVRHGPVFSARPHLAEIGAGRKTAFEPRPGRSVNAF